MTINLAFWNILFDKENHYHVPEQRSRTPDLAKILRSLPVKADVYGLAEVQRCRDVNNGDVIAGLLHENKGNWVKNNTNVRDDELVGIFGRKAGAVRAIDMGNGRVAAKFEVSGVTFVLVHLTFAILGKKKRLRQIESVLKSIDVLAPAVIFGDFNNTSFSDSRTLLKKQGFESVFYGKPRVSTVLSHKYYNRAPLKLRVATVFGFRPDDIYVRGVSVNDCGVFEGESDHRGVWASIETK